MLFLVDILLVRWVTRGSTVPPHPHPVSPRLACLAPPGLPAHRVVIVGVRGWEWNAILLVIHIPVGSSVSRLCVDILIQGV